MSAVSSALIETIKKLQGIADLQQFSLAGGTNLAMRYNHRVSVDIDLITNKVIGEKGYRQIINQVTELFGNDILNYQLINIDVGDQYTFLRFFIVKGGANIKVEILQNIQHLFSPETYNGVVLLSKIDIGLLKLMSASNRFARKDIYDLDYITDEISIIELFDRFKEKCEKYKDTKYHNLFDLDNESSPLKNPELLLEFDNRSTNHKKDKPFHSNHKIDIVDGNKSWGSARLSWRRKVRQLYNHLDLEFPSPKGFKSK